MLPPVFRRTDMALLYHYYNDIAIEKQPKIVHVRSFCTIHWRQDFTYDTMLEKPVSFSG